MLESSGGLIPLKGKWVEVDREKLKEALEHWKNVEKDVRREGISFFEGMRLLSGANLAKRKMNDQQAAIREWSGLTAGPELEAILQGLRSPETRQEKAPPDLKAELRAYQQTGYAWLRFVARLGLGACLADDMGLGKTIQVISPAARPEARSPEKGRQPARRAGFADRELEGGAGAGSLRACRSPWLILRKRTRSRELGRDDADRVRSDHHHLRHACPQRVDEDASLAAGDSRRGPGDQELRHEADPGREGADRRRAGSP